jgi:hypothetical protein
LRAIAVLEQEPEASKQAQHHAGEKHDDDDFDQAKPRSTADAQTTVSTIECGARLLENAAPLGAHMISDRQTTWGRRQLVLMLLIAAVSLGGSYLLFFSLRDGNPWGTTNHGTLVTPARALADLNIYDESGGRVTQTGQWWLWVLTFAPCAAECEQALHQLRQLHILLNRDAGRVRRALVLDGTLRAHGLRERYPQLTILSGGLDGLVSGVYVVDPLGNLVLWYPLADAGEPVLDDLKALLKVSQIG